MASKAAGGKACAQTSEHCHPCIDPRKKSCKSAYSRNSSAVEDTEVSETSPILINEDTGVCGLCRG